MTDNMAALRPKPTEAMRQAKSRNVRHVLTEAIVGRMLFILTWNVRHFRWGCVKTFAQPITSFVLLCTTKARWS